MTWVSGVTTGAEMAADFNEVSHKASTGWSVHQDTQYTEGSPLNIVGGAAYVNLPNNSGSVIDLHKPADIAALFAAGKITGIDGEVRALTISFAVKPTTGTAPRVSVGMDIGGAVGFIDAYERDTTYAKGNGVEHRYLSSFDVYTLDTWAANGGQLKIKSTTNCSIYDIRILVTATVRV